MHRYLLLQETTVRRRRGSGEEISVMRLPASFQFIWCVSGDCYSGMLQGGRRALKGSMFGHCNVLCVRLSPYTQSISTWFFFGVEVILFVLPGVENIISP